MYFSASWKLLMKQELAQFVAWKMQIKELSPYKCDHEPICYTHACSNPTSTLILHLPSLQLAHNAYRKIQQ